MSDKLVMPDWEVVRKDLTDQNVTKHLLWEEYTQQYPNSSYSYSQYCHHFGVWLAKQKRSMHQIHKTGETLFVDYAGQTMPVICSSTSEVRNAQIFVAAMGRATIPIAKPPGRKACQTLAG